MLEYTTIFNNDNLIYKYEVYVKGVAIKVDSFGRPVGKQSYVQKLRAFRNQTNATLFIQGQQDLYDFIGDVA